MHTLFQDLRFALRQMRRSPMFSSITVLTLAIGIAATTAVFSLVNAVLLRSLPFADADRLVALDTLERPAGATGPGIVSMDVSWPDFFDWRAQAKSFSSMTGYVTGAANLQSAAGPAQRINGMHVSADFFRVLGVRPALGRGFNADEDVPGNRSVVLSDALSQSEFHGSADAIGKVIRIGGEPCTVIGVMPRTFRFPGLEDNSYWASTAQQLEGKHSIASNRGYHTINVLARLRPGVSIEAARTEMQILQGAFAKQYPETNARMTNVSVQREIDALTGDVRAPLRILFGAVCALLLIACANVAGLFLARTGSRRGELAVRAALGASRMQIVRQLLLESLTLSLAGGLAGLLLAATLLHGAARFLPKNLPRVDQVGIDLHVALFAVGLSLLTGLLFGVVPAWRGAHVQPARALGDSARGSTTARGQGRLHGALVIAETAVSLVLLVGAGLLMRSFNRLTHIDLGFTPEHVLTFRVGLISADYNSAKQTQLMRRLQEGLKAVPGVQNATYAFPHPLTGGDVHIVFTIDGRATPPGEEPSARLSTVSSTFFQTFGIPLRRGRIFSEAEDSAKMPPIVMVNEAFARQYFPGESAVGKHFTPWIAEDDAKPTSREIIGVVGNVKRTTLTEAAMPEYYLPNAQASLAVTPLAIRVQGDPDAYADTVRRVVAEVDSSVPVYKVASYTSLLERTTALQRFQAFLLTAFAAVALLLAAIGLYAVLSYMVAQRTPELGLRMALGAQRGNVLAIVLRRGLMYSATGLLLGLLLSVGLTRVVANILYATQPLDALTFTCTTVLLFTVAAVASLLPALRASRLNPNETLRQQ